MTTAILTKTRMAEIVAEANNRICEAVKAFDAS